MFLGLSVQKFISCWKFFPSIHYYLATSSVLKCWPLLLGSKRIPKDENSMGTSRVLWILLFQMKQKKNCSLLDPWPYHRFLCNSFLYEIPCMYAELTTVTLYRQYREVLLPPLIRQESWLIPNIETLLFPHIESLPGTTLCSSFQILHFHNTSVQPCSIWEEFHGYFESPSLAWSVCAAAAVEPWCLHS